MVYAFLPFLSAALYGLGYILIDRMLKNVPVLSYMLVNSLLFSSILLLVGLARRSDLSFTFLFDRKMLFLFIATLTVNAVAWVITLISLKNNNAVYTAFAEISYPLFTLLFLYLIFGVHQWNWQSAAGSALIFAGSAVLIMAQLKAVMP